MRWMANESRHDNSIVSQPCNETSSPDPGGSRLNTRSAAANIKAPPRWCRECLPIESNGLSDR
jgi:hypothetical protein